MDDTPAGPGDQPGALSAPAALSSEAADATLPEARPSSVATQQPTSLDAVVPALEQAAEDAGTAGPGEAAPAELLTLSGRVLDPGGRPVAAAQVAFHARSAMLLGVGSARRPTATRPETRTDKDGRFELEVPLPEAAPADLPLALARSFIPRLAVVADGFSVLAHECESLALPGVDLGDLHLDYGTSLHGVVLDSAGRAVAAAEVMARTAREMKGSEGTVLLALSGNAVAQNYTRTTTDAAGRFRIEGLVAGRQSLDVSAEGMQARSVSGLETTVGQSLDVGVITLDDGASIAGVVLTERGDPVEGASVRVSSMARMIVTEMSDDARPQLGREWQLRATTDENGQFELSGLGSGQFTVHANADGYASAEQPNVASGTHDVRLVVGSLSGAFLRVLSAADGGGLDDVSVQVSRRPSDGGPVRIMRGRSKAVVLSGAEALAAAGRDDDDPRGAYFIKGIDPDGALLEFVAPRFAAHELEIDAAGGDEFSEHRVELLPASLLAGVVLDGNGEALPEALVKVTAYEPPSEQIDGVISFTEDVSINVGENETVDWTRVRTDSQGRFRFESLPAGEWVVEASSPEAAPGEPAQVSLEEGEQRTGLVLRLESAGWVSGVVLEEDGTPVSHADVIAKFLDAAPAGGGPAGALSEQIGGAFAAELGLGGGDDQRSVACNADGRFELRGLAPGRWEFSLRANGGVMLGGATMFLIEGPSVKSDDSSAQVVSVLANQESYVEIVRPPQSSLQGRVTAAGQPVEGVTLRLAKADSFMPMGGRSAETGPGGHFSFDDVTPGAYDLSAIVPGAAHRKSERVELEPGRSGQQDLAFGGITLRGRVVDADTGDGVPDAKITASPVVENASSGFEGFGGIQIVSTIDVDDELGGGGMEMRIGGGSSSTVRTDADGRFEVRFLDAGDWSLECEGGGYAAGEAGPIEVTDDSTSEEVVIEVQRAAAIFGRVTDGNTGLPLDGVPVSVALVGSGFGAFGGGEMVMTSQGEYSVEGLDPGEYSVSVLGSGFGGEPLARETVRVGSGEQREVDLTTEP
ncbi:MAG: hypothetical protein DHS20C15_07650 [Planctomycetota bacterium]|nr:MAG: hypothetical protein DHS20C15_07650 [Planctomycetota bacterium]